MNFKCKCGKTLAANIEPGQTAFVNCACSLRYMATITESGTLIVCREIKEDELKYRNYNFGTNWE